MRAFLIVVASLIAVTFALLVGPYFISTAKLEEEMLSDLKKVINADVFIESFHFRVLPYPAFTIEGFNVTSLEPEFKGQSVMKAGKVEGGLSPGALLKGNIITDVTLKDAVVNLEISSDGKSIIGLPMAVDTGNKIRSLRIKDGKITLAWDSDKSIVIDDVRLNATDVKLKPQFKGKIRLKGVLKNIGEIIDLAGSFSFESKEKIFKAKQISAFISGVRYNVDATLIYGQTPKSFDIHMVSPNLNVNALSKLWPKIKSDLPFAITSEGPIVSDMEFKGTLGNIAFKIHADATANKIKWGNLFFKEQNKPFKFIFDGNYETTHIAIESATFLVGENSFKISGSVLRQPDYPSQLTLETTAFKALEVLPLLPFLAQVREMENPSISLQVRGPLFNEKSRVINGRFNASKVNIYGHSFLNLETDFGYKPNVFNLNSIRAKFYDGSLSGNGAIYLGDIPRYEYSMVVGDIDCSKMLAPNPIIKGTGSLVFKGEARENLLAEGTLILKKGDISSLRIGKNVFADKLWDILKQNAPSGLNEEQIKELNEMKGEIDNLKASFELKDGYLLIRKLDWSTPKYEALVKAYINPQDIVTGEGDIYLSQREVLKLITNVAERKELTESNGKLDIPLKISGRLMEINLKPYDKKKEAPSAFVFPGEGKKEEKISMPSKLPSVAPPALTPLTIPEKIAAPAKEAAVLPAPEIKAPELKPIEPPPVVEKKQEQPAVEKKAIKKKVATEPKRKRKPRTDTKTDTKTGVDDDVFKVFVGD